VLHFILIVKTRRISIDMIFFQDRHYPKVGTFIRTDMRHFENTHPFIFSAFVTALQGDRKLARDAISGGRRPVVKIVEEFPKVCNFPGIVAGTAPGGFCNALPNDVYVKKREADGLEDFGKSGSFARVLLHECVHWGRFDKGLPSRIHGIEAGDMFEYLAGYSDKLRDHEDIPGPTYV
jgi:hypothetical protein